MRQKFRWELIMLLLLSSFIHFPAPGMGNETRDFPTLKGPYLGQKPPGMVPELFAPGIICTEKYEGASAFSIDGKLFIFRRLTSYMQVYPDIYMMKEMNSRWTKPQPLSFQGKYRAGDFTLAPDGKTLYFASNRPLKGDGEPLTTGDNLWKVEITEEGWSKPRPFGSLINTERHESYPSLAGNGTLYFFRREPKVRTEIYRSRLVDGQYTEPKDLGAPINTEFDEWDPYIAPDESYLVFCSTKPAGYGEDDLYISFKKEDNSWANPINMGAEINSAGSENRPYVTLDGKYLFFTSTKRPGKGIAAKAAGSRDIYWVDARIIGKFKIKAFK